MTLHAPSLPVGSCGLCGGRHPDPALNCCSHIADLCPFYGAEDSGGMWRRVSSWVPKGQPAQGLPRCCLRWGAGSPRPGLERFLKGAAPLKPEGTTG